MGDRVNLESEREKDLHVVSESGRPQDDQFTKGETEKGESVVHVWWGLADDMAALERRSSH